MFYNIPFSFYLIGSLDITINWVETRKFSVMAWTSSCKPSSVWTITIAFTFCIFFLPIYSCTYFLLCIPHRPVLELMESGSCSFVFWLLKLSFYFSYLLYIFLYGVWWCSCNLSIVAQVVYIIFLNLCTSKSFCIPTISWLQLIFLNIVFNYNVALIKYNLS